MSEHQDENEQIAERRRKLDELRRNSNAYPNDFAPTNWAGEVHARWGDEDNVALQQSPVAVKLAGRLMTRRIMGKASFGHIQDMSGHIQLRLERNRLGEELYRDFKHWDLGDILGVEGTLFRTNTGELTVQVEAIRLLTKALRPLPEKYHGLVDQEARYRQRYLDLLVNENTRRTFRKRSQITDYLRSFLNGRGFVEVETPMMQPIPGGAMARPFITHHKALDMDLYLRVAPELYLKRLVIGGLERVYEINRSFRNEGLSTEHNPEFTMLEFYQAYATYLDLMDLTEEIFRGLAQHLSADTTVSYQGETYDFARPFERMSVREAVLRFNPSIDSQALSTLATARAIAEELDIELEPGVGLGKVLTALFEKTVESQLRQPTFITAFPTEVSPLARRNDQDPTVTDRFELFVGGRELANGFSELNDPDDQAERFRRQLAQKQAGDEEAMHFDADYIRALEHGMPPTAGEGIGIDRLVMLFTNSPSIRDVVLFPQLRPAGGHSR